MARRTPQTLAKRRREEAKRQKRRAKELKRSIRKAGVVITPTDESSDSEKLEPTVDD